MRSPEHLVPDAAPVSSQRLQAPSRHHGPALYQPVNYRSRGQSALISGFPLSAILGKPFPAKAADTPNPHKTAKRSPLSRGFVLRRLSDAGHLTRVDRSRPAGIRNPTRKRPLAIVINRIGEKNFSEARI